MVKFLDNNSGFNQWNANQNAAKSRSKFGGFLWWFIIFLIVWWIMGLFVGPAQKTATDASETVVIEDAANVPESNISSDKISATVRGLRIYDIKLAGFTRGGNGDDADTPVVLLGNDKNFAEIGLVATGAVAPTPQTVWRTDGDALKWRNNDGIEFSRTISVDDYVITVRDEIKNNSKKDATFAPYARVVRDKQGAESSGVYTGAVAFANSDVEHADWRKLAKKSYAYSTTRGFVGFADQYWESIVSIDQVDQTLRAKQVGNFYQADASAGAVVVAPGATETITTHIFAGPRDQSVLNAAASKIAGIERTVDYGWFWFLARPMLWVINAINSVVMNYGVAIIIMTLILRLLMWPLTRKSYTSMIAMQKMQPEMTRIQKLYANDKARMQMEMMRLYQTHKTSPMSGCLPMLIQIPIFFALYKALLISVQMRSAHFLWISDLAAMDPYFILPILMGLTMWWQQKLQTSSQKNAPTNDVAAQTQRVMRWMPWLFTIMFAWMPAGLVLYWTVSNLFGLAQMQIIKRQTK